MNRIHGLGLNAYRNYTTHNHAVSKAIERVASGFRINRAADDASGFMISEKMRFQIRALQGASDELDTRAASLDTIDGQLYEIGDLLARMAELATQSMSDTYSDRRNELDFEYQTLADEVASISKQDRVQTTVISLRDGFVGDPNTEHEVYRGQNIGAFLDGLEHHLDSLAGGDIGKAQSDFAHSYATQLLNEPGDRQAALSYTVHVYDSGISIETRAGEFVDLCDSNLLTGEDAAWALDIVGEARGHVVTARTTLAADQRRIEAAKNNFETLAENLTAAMSHIKDADLARETMNLVKSQILSQTSAAMMAQVKNWDANFLNRLMR